MPLDADPWAVGRHVLHGRSNAPGRSRAEQGGHDVFLKQRAEFGRSVAFYLDCGDYLARYCDRAQAVRALTDATMILPDAPDLARMVARRLDRLGEHPLATEVYQRVLALSPDDPQSYRDLALALADAGDRAANVNTRASRPVAVDCYRRAMDLLRTVATRTWTRSPGIQVVALTECGAILNKARAVDPDVRSPMDQSIGGLLDMDLRIVLTWDTSARMSLSVVEPSSEEATSQKTTTIGGMIFNDCVDGYGPQEYCLRRLMPGRYVIKVSATGIAGNTRHTTVQATVIRDFGRATEKRQVLSVVIPDKGGNVEVGAVTLGEEDGHNR